MKDLSRRDFMRGIAGAAGAAALTSILDRSVLADEPKGESAGNPAAEEKPADLTFADTIYWHAWYDVVVLGMGAAGMAAAKTAADCGAKVLIAEKCPEEEAGGNTKASGQLFAWANGDAESALAYYTALAAGRAIPEAIVKIVADGVADMGRILEEEFGFDSAEYVNWSGRWNNGANLGSMSPEYPELPGSEAVSLMTVHNGVYDGYFYEGLRKNIVERADSIDVWYNAPAVELIQDPFSKTVIGVRIRRRGITLNVRAVNGVCICTGGFESNPDMVQQYLDIEHYAVSGGQFNTGDGIRMAQAAGADLWHMDCYEGSIGFGGLTWPVESGTPCAQPAALTHNPLNTGATVLIGGGGDRFVNESQTVRHGRLPFNGSWQHPVYPEKIWLIFDEKQKDLIQKNRLMTEEEWENVREFRSAADLAEAIGCEADVLQDTLDSYRLFARHGKDHQFKRETKYMRTFEGTFVYAVEAVPGIWNTDGGPRRNENAEILDVKGRPIPHLYAAGECGGITAGLYQEGTGLAECILFGRIAGTNAAASKEELPPIVLRAVVSSPTPQGMITDLVVEEEEAAEAE